MNEIEAQKRMKVSIGIFNDSITNENPVYFRCTKCHASVKATAQVQKEMSHGGLGHHCNECDTYFAIVSCPNCQENLGFDDKEWDGLLDIDVTCSNCGIFLYRSHHPNFSLQTNGGQIKTELCCWGNSPEESQYITFSLSNFTPIIIEKLSTRHYTVGFRVKASKQSLDYILNNEWSSPFAIFNNNLCVGSKTIKSPYDFDFQNTLFSFVNNLRSSLDILAQEIAITQAVKTPEHEIDFIKQNYLKSSNKRLKEILDQYTNTEHFKYLNKLRNTLQHRKTPMLVTHGDYDLTEIDSIRPTNAYMKANIKLPDDPYKDEKDYTYTQNIDIFVFMENIFTLTNNLIETVYLQMTQEGNNALT